MWDSPAWIGSLISGKVSKYNAEQLRASNEAIAEADRASREAIAARQIASNEAITAERVRADQEIAEANRTNQADIATKQRESAEKIALLENATKIVTHVLPIALGSKVISNDKGNKSSGGTGSGSASGVSVGTTESAKQKADAIFPNIEPTFGSDSPLTSIKSLWNSGVNAGLLGLTLATLTSVPILGL